jgi:hypothetical protein
MTPALVIFVWLIGAAGMFGFCKHYFRYKDHDGDEVLLVIFWPITIPGWIILGFMFHAGKWVAGRVK